MKFFLLIFILMIGFYSFKFIWSKAKLNKNFNIYKKDLIKVKNSLNNLNSKDLDKLSYSGIIFDRFNIIMYYSLFSNLFIDIWSY